jgi:hypothetical protein
LQKLLKDGYVICDKPTPEFKDWKYSLNFEGAIFRNNGGYRADKRKKTFYEILQSSMSIGIGLGTLLASLGTVVYFISNI